MSITYQKEPSCNWSTRYKLGDDGSRLDIYPSRSEGVAFDNGKRIATHTLLINK
jgi:hypothetical protein